MEERSCAIHAPPTCSYKSVIILSIAAEQVRGE